MKKINIHFLIRLFLFWLVLFTLARTALLVLMTTMPGTGNLEGFPFSFLYGLRTDLSAISYLLAIPTMLFFIASLSKNKIWAKVLNGINILLIYVSLLLILSNLGVYKGWGTLINARAISFIQDPAGIIASLSTIQLTGLIITVVVLFGVAGILYYRYFAFNISSTKKSQAAYGLFILALLPVGMRGGFQEIPINESAAYFSQKMPLNHLAANPLWNLANSINKSGLNTNNPYEYFDEQTAERLSNEFICHHTDTTRILQHTKPNIILIVLESWSADIIGPLSQDSLTTPYFNSLCKEGYLFSRIYSSGRRTDQMLPSILSGFPAPPQHSIARFNDKLPRLPMLSTALKQAGYETSFIYGGELGFANMHSFLLQANFNRITGKNDFPAAQMNSKWGAHDEYIFEKAIQQAKGSSPPFFQMILTLSTHEPFEVPGISSEKTLNERQKFRQAAGYTDRCLREYFKSVSTQPWYNNTLFILVADHGHHLPGGRNYFDPEGYHIPLLFLGPSLQPEMRGKTNTGIGGQHEIANTILTQIQLNDSAFRLGSSLIRSCGNAAAYLNFDEAFGVISDRKQFVYLFGEKQYVSQYSTEGIAQDSSYTNQGKAYLQTIYRRFLDL